MKTDIYLMAKPPKDETIELKPKPNNRAKMLEELLNGLETGRFLVIERSEENED